MSRSFVRRLAGQLKPAPAATGLDDELAVFFDLAEVLLVVLGPDGVIRRVNRLCADVFGRHQSEIVGRRWKDLVKQEDQLDGKRRTLIVRPDASERRIDWRFAGRPGGDGTLAEVVASGQDVTETETARTQLDGLRRLAQDVAALDDAREAIVRHALSLTESASVLLAENGMVTASAGEDFAPGLEAMARVAHTGTALTAGPSVYHPVHPGGVLVITWRGGVPAEDSYRATVVPLLADEAAVALRRLSTMKSLEEAALVDALTGIPNRRAFDHELPLEMAKARRSGTRVALATLDLNGFKALNDTHGHEAGDRVLKATASAWAAELRSTDFLARLGGDEFAVILPNCDADGVRQVVRRLRAAVPHSGGTSIGIAVWDGRETPADFMRRSDQALYTDKALTGAAR